MTQAEPPRPDDSWLTPKHQIMAGTMTVAVLAGVGIAAIDAPASLEFAPRRMRAAPVSAPERAAVAAVPASVSVAPAAPVRNPAAVVAAPAKPAKKARTAPSSARPARPASVAPPTLDQRYDALVARKCREDMLGLLCREAVRWRLCDGRWADRAGAGETRCLVGGKAAG